MVIMVIYRTNISNILHSQESTRNHSRRLDAGSHVFGIAHQYGDKVGKLHFKGSQLGAFLPIGYSVLLL